jgi:DNA primase catalytic core
MSKGKLSADFLQQLKDAVNLVDVVGEHVVLKKSGSNFTGLCPFHNERSPSFSVSEQKQLYHCYGCHKGGDLIGFVQEMHGLSFIEAVEDLADRANIPLPKDFRGSDGDTPEADKKRAAQREKTLTAYKLNRFAAKFFRDQLKKQKHITEYFKSRAVTDELSQGFYLGAAPASWDSLASFFVQAKAPMELAAELGLIKASQKAQKPGGPGYFDLFRNRAMFPILDLKGKVVGFGGRGLPLPPGAPDVGDGTPKYLNSSESTLFQKSKLLYGLFQAQKHIREKDEAILVEGYFDVIGMQLGGFQNVVATCGTSLTVDHLQLLKKFTSKITILFDGDRAGIAATDRAMEMGLQNGMILYGAALPKGMDPDELIVKEGREAMLGVLAASQPILDSRIEAAFRHSLKGTEQKSQALKQVAEWLSMFTDPVGREMRMDTVQKQFQVSRDLMVRAMSAKPADKRKSTQPQAPANPNQITIGMGANQGQTNTRRQKLTPRESVLVSGVTLGGAYLTIIQEAIHYMPPGRTLVDLASHEGVRNFLTGVLVEGLRGQDLLSRLEDSQLRAVVSEALVGGGQGDGENSKGLSNNDFKHAVQKGLSLIWARFSQELKQRLKDAELKKDAGLHAELQKEYLDVQRRMKEFDTFYDED